MTPPVDPLHLATKALDALLHDWGPSCALRPGHIVELVIDVLATRPGYSTIWVQPTLAHTALGVIDTAAAA